LEIIGKRKRLAKDEVVVSFYLVFTMHKNLKPRRYESLASVPIQVGAANHG